MSALIVLGLLLSAFASALLGCPPPKPNGGNQGSNSGSSGAAGGEETLARIKKAGVLKWSGDSAGGAPFIFDDPKNPGTVIGFEIEMMALVAKHMGVKSEMVQGKWDYLPNEMDAKRSDMVVNGYEINEARKAKYAFSKPYYKYEQQITIRVADKDKYKSLADLKGKPIGTLVAAEANNVLLRAGWTEELLKASDDSSLPYAELENGRVEGVLQESIIAQYYTKGKAKLFNLPETFAPGTYGVMMRPEDKTLIAEVDRVLDLMRENGELAAIYKKWEIWTEAQKSLGIKEK